MGDLLCRDVEESIAVGSRGTLLSLIGREMTLLQARKSCSVPDSRSSSSLSAYFNGSKQNINRASCNREPAAVCGGSDLHKEGAGAVSPAFINVASSLWSDLKGLLRSPSSVHHQCYKCSPPLNIADIDGVNAHRHHECHNAPFLALCSDEEDDDSEQVDQLDALFNIDSSSSSRPWQISSSAAPLASNRATVSTVEYVQNDIIAKKGKQSAKAAADDGSERITAAGAASWKLSSSSRDGKRYVCIKEEFSARREEPFTPASTPRNINGRHAAYSSASAGRSTNNKLAAVSHVVDLQHCGSSHSTSYSSCPSATPRTTTNSLKLLCTPKHTATRRPSFARLISH
ncbi:hypothetical protein L7F22_027683 [Adiantum nelumboides]|nr:hypothetical protein [Adiantum nelumboides]